MSRWMAFARLVLSMNAAGPQMNSTGDQSTTDARPNEAATRQPPHRRNAGTHASADSLNATAAGEHRAGERGAEGRERERQRDQEPERRVVRTVDAGVHERRRGGVDREPEEAALEGEDRRDDRTR